VGAGRLKILNFGALMAFMAVNLAAVKHFGFSPGMAGNQQFGADVIVLAWDFLFCLVIFLGLQNSTLVAGAIWTIVGRW